MSKFALGFYQVDIAHRDQVSLVIDLDHVQDHDADLYDAIVENTRRYAGLFGDVVHEILPDYKEREVCNYLRLNFMPKYIALIS